MSKQQINVVLVSIRDFPKKKKKEMVLGGLENIFLYKRGARQKKFGNHWATRSCLFTQRSVKWVLLSDQPGGVCSHFRGHTLKNTD